MSKNLNQMDYSGRNCRQILTTTHAAGLAETSSGYMFCNNLEAMKQYHRNFKSQIKKANAKTPKIIVFLLISALKAVNIIF